MRPATNVRRSAYPLKALPPANIVLPMKLNVYHISARRNVNGRKVLVNMTNLRV